MNAAITIVTQNQSSLMIPLNGSGIQLGQAIGASIASINIVNLNIASVIFMSTITAVITGAIFCFLIYKKNSFQK